VSDKFYRDNNLGAAIERSYLLKLAVGAATNYLPDKTPTNP
jgi:hypothetical protein